MNKPSNHSEHLEAGSSTGLESSKRAAGDQGSARTKISGPRLKALLAAGVVIAVGLAVYFIAISPRIENSKELAAAAVAAGQKTVIVILPTQTSSAPEITLPGNIEANQMTSIYSRVDGYLKRWYVDIGDQVQEDQVLADVESPTVDASLRQAQAELELAEANLRLAQTNSARSQQLFQNKVNSQQELDTVLANEQVQKATRDNAAAALTSAQDMKGFEQIRAPFAGNITARYVDV
jgi:multidrug efflux pump subunit AcrA (membrane-fusion protein)